MRVEYDAEVDAAYIYLADVEPGSVSDTVEGEGMAEGVNLDFDAEGKLIGIEVLDASARLSEELLEQA
jgi:uncharacterized protein YuzE